MDSAQLLRDYTEKGNEFAFSVLVGNYVSLVYSTALRRAGGNDALARDIVQTVFTDLAQKASALPAEVQLGGWLHHHTCYVASNHLRSERRRQTREQVAAAMN